MRLRAKRYTDSKAAPEYSAQEALSATQPRKASSRYERVGCESKKSLPVVARVAIRASHDRASRAPVTLATETATPPKGRTSRNEMTTKRVMPTARSDITSIVNPIATARITASAGSMPATTPTTSAAPRRSAETALIGSSARAVMGEGAAGPRSLRQEVEVH